MRENPELLACPFCGGNAQSGFDYFHHHGGHVQCSQCDVTGPVWSNNTDEAIEAWNRRSLRTGGDPVAWQWSDFSGKWYTLDTARLTIEEQETMASAIAEAHEGRYRPLFAAPPPSPKGEVSAPGKFKLGDRVRKIKGSSWHGRVVGFYSTELTPIGYNVESERESGSVQIYPEAALEANHE